MYKFVFILLLLYVAAGCHKDRKIGRQLSQIEKIMAIAPDSSLGILKQLNVSDLPTGRAQARYSLLLSEALEKNDIYLTHDSVIRIAVEYYSHRGSRREKAKTFYYLGRIYENAQDFDAAVGAYTRASELLEKGDHRLRGLIFYGLGNLYSEQLSYPEALDMYSRASEAFRAEGNEQNLCYALRSEAWALVMLHDAKNALAKCQEPLEIAKRQNDTSQILVLSQYIAALYTFDYNNARTAFTFLDSVYRQYNRNVVPVDDYSLWGYIHLKTGDLKTAAYYISKADSITDNLYVLSGYHALQSAYLEEEKRYKEALSAYKLSAELKDSAYMAEKEHLIQDLERRYKTQSLQNSLNLLKTKEQYQFVIMALLGIIFAIVIVIILRRIAKDKKEKERKLEEYRNFIDQMQHDYNEIENEYHSLFRHSNLQDEKLAGFKEVLNDRLVSIRKMVEIAATSGNNSELFLKKFRAYMHIENGKSQQLFCNLQELVNLHFNGIVDYLKEHYPNLSYEDLNLCCLIYLKIPANGIQLICNYTNSDSLYNRRSKIRQRMGLSSGTNLEDFLEKLLHR